MGDQQKVWAQVYATILAGLMVSDRSSDWDKLRAVARRETDIAMETAGYYNET